MDDGEDTDHNVFSSARLWKQSSHFADPEVHDSTLLAPLQLDISSIKFDHPYAPKHDLEQELRLPDLDSFEFGPLPELEPLDDSAISSEPPPEVQEEDLWQVALELGPANKDILFHTWEGFDNPEHSEKRTAYLTECGSEVFDAVLASNDSKVPAGRVIKGDVLLQSLWNLGLGRSSILFHFEENLKTFKPAISDGRASGVSLVASQSLITRFVHIGNTFVYLRSFCERTFHATTSLPARVALATSVANVLSALEDHLGKQSAQVKSLLQLQHHFSKPHDVLVHLTRMVDSIKHAKNNEQLSSILHHRLLETEEGESHLNQLSLEILRQVSRPSLELLEEWLGTGQEQLTIPVASRESFVVVEGESTEEAPIEYVYRSEMMPRFISPEDGNAIFETGNSLRFLTTQHADHPLVNLDKYGVEPPHFEWAFGWQDIENIANKAKAYEDALRKTLLEHSQGEHAEVTLPVREKEAHLQEEMRPADLDGFFERSMEQFDALPKHTLLELPDEISQIMTRTLTSYRSDEPTTNTFFPPLSLASSLSFRPLVMAQARMINAVTLRLFFRYHHLQHHLTLQRQYQLLGDGVFSSLLSAALFDPNRESATRHKGKMRTGVNMGLNLGSRTNWPPASSELRLALRGVLSESYYSSPLYLSSQLATSAVEVTGLHTRDNDELPGNLNFAIRNLTEEQQESVMDPNTLSALDFLRLQYVPPPPLHLIMTSPILEKYDVIFKFLLRLLRILFVVDHLPRTYSDLASRQFRLEAHHFVISFARYVFSTAIASPWTAFDAFVNTIEKRLHDEDSAAELGTRVTEGIASIRDAQEKCLDNILHALFLRKRQRKILALLDEILELILLFANNLGPNVRGEEGETPSELRGRLRAKIKVFVSVCRELAAKEGYAGASRTGMQENGMAGLVFAVEGGGWY